MGSLFLSCSLTAEKMDKSPKVGAKVHYTLTKMVKKITNVKFE